MGPFIDDKLKLSNRNRKLNNNINLANNINLGKKFISVADHNKLLIKLPDK
jgi:hypothetical protein